MVSRKILIALGLFAVLAIWIASVAAVQNIEVDGIKSVSYTHLDVYKRQLRYRPKPRHWRRNSLKL